ncbi:ABC transporter substrate-binding protein [Hymenobacter cavernae]|uniref:Nickel ABC transporter, nickel/metallophore periplasmic binding protein n=1 Tax=Hymenobacter cavernae TaxID=2044852 RepID=A0ABQ1TIJ7_9BACT|nr:ABC transporter substrate-binding protein [Hymenobacter cavernae]GGE96388.1 nickel ABC transporter, nickel/metallophore periplasmic binding protein [Hymenobacter cavernae]
MLHTYLLASDNITGTPAPWLAEAIPTIQRTDSLTLITYRLRKKARWDNGEPVSAHDVAFTLKVMNCPGLPNEAVRARFDFIEDVLFDKNDNRHFTLVCRGRAPEFLKASGDYPILPEYALDPQRTLRSFSLRTLQKNDNTFAANPVITAFVRRYLAADLPHHPERLPGCGPYQLQKWHSGQQLTFKRKRSWWADQLRPVPAHLLARPTTIEYQVIPDVGTSLLALRRGEIDIYPLVPAKDFYRLSRSEAARRLQFHTFDSYEMVTLGFNTRHPLLQDKLTRRALSHLVDIPGLIKATQQGVAQRTVGLISPHNRAAYNDSLPLLSYDLTAATLLLQKAGWLRQADGRWLRRMVSGQTQPLSLTVSYRAGDPLYEQVAAQFQTAATLLGVPVRLRPTEASVLTGKLKSGEFELYIRTLMGNPFIFNFAPILHSASVGTSNYTGFGTPTSDKLIEAIALEENPKRKIRLLRKFQILLQQESPLVPLFFLPYRLIASNQIANLQPSGLNPGYEVKTIITQSAN